MSLEAALGGRSASPTSSGRSTPIPRASRRAEEDGAVHKGDKIFRKYAVVIERALSSWEISPEEWADYIAFLGRLLKAIQSHPKDIAALPHSTDVASKLSQCMNPALPSGVHQKALEVYAYIFSTFGHQFVSGHLDDFFPGLSAVLSFASLSVRPALYDILEEHILPLSPIDLRPLLKALILSLLPALEDETSEDFERAFRILEILERKFTEASESSVSSERTGFFWQCLFLVIITSPQRRQGALNFLVHKLPKFEHTATHAQNSEQAGVNGTADGPSTSAEAVTSPEPGLLIRAFICGLTDPQLLIQRGFLDLLVTHLPISSSLLQSRVRKDDLDRLVHAAMLVLLRREMSLNRRLWSWFLGPEPKNEAADSFPSSPVAQKDGMPNGGAPNQLQYFSKYGKPALERSVLAMFKREYATVAERARPFRLCLSLMDRWEIGGSIVPEMFLPAIEGAFEFSLRATASDTAELIRSASLFFDSIEPSLIWSTIIELIESAFTSGPPGFKRLQLCKWILQQFSVKDEEMITSHIPRCALFILSRIQTSPDAGQDTIDVSLELASLLITGLPDRALPLEQSGNDALTSSSDPIPPYESISRSYQPHHSTESVNKATRPDQITLGLWRNTMSLLLHTLQQKQASRFCRMALILADLQSKAPSLNVFQSADFLPKALALIDYHRPESEVLAFPIIASLISMVVAIQSMPSTASHVSDTILARLESALTPQIWQHLSPGRVKYHVEATRTLWHLHDLTGSSYRLEATLSALVRPSAKKTPVSASHDPAEAVRRFAVLWSHSITVQGTNAKLGPPGTLRRASAMPPIDVKQSVGRQEVLTEPLMLVLDTLSEPQSPSHAAVLSWIHSLPTLEHVFNIHFDMLDELLNTDALPEGPNDVATQRARAATIRDLEYVLEHFASILKHRNDWVSQCLGHMELPGEKHGAPTSGLLCLVQHCCRFICDGRFRSRPLEHSAMSIINMALSGSDPDSFKAMELDTILIDRLLSLLDQPWSDSQIILLKLIMDALRLRLATEVPDSDSLPTRSRSSISSKRPSTAGLRPSPNDSSAALAVSPPAKLLLLLKSGFGSRKARQHLDKWLEFLSQVLPAFSDAIFAGLLPLVECLCTELNEAHAELVEASQIGTSSVATAPEGTIMALLEAMEMVLARAHRCLEDEMQHESEERPAPQTRGLFANVASGVFKAEGPPSRTSHANSRLTVILTFQDAIRVSLRLWIWASHSTEVDNFDKNSAATTSYNALKVRNRTRHLLEQIFAVEPLESLEVVISNWRSEKDDSRAAASLNLLHVLQGTRPKNVIPAILDSLCSRTNPSALPIDRLSTQSTDLSALDAAVFLSAYLNSTEDDAMDEVWPDCMAFLRDVLSNPLPYRQVLPALLLTILLLAQKIENTNFGEQRKMRKELGDSFNRLLSATFTTMPSGYTQDPQSTDELPSRGENAPSAMVKNSTSLIAALKEVTTNIEAILETAERTTGAMNTISASLIGPMFRAKSFPNNITPDTLRLLLQITKKAPQAKTWKKELLEAFNDARLLTSDVESMARHWFPVLYQWCLHDRERMPELLSRLAPPSSAGIMFGVGANAARLEADRKTQLNIRRISILMLASPEDTFSMHLRLLNEKLAELFDATTSSSPSATVQAELFMLCRAIVLSISSVQLAPMWPIINANLHSALASLLPAASNEAKLSNLSLLQACKLLDLLITLSPDEFQLHEWLYVTDTIDAVYQPVEWDPSALSDQIAAVMARGGVDESSDLVPPTPITASQSGQRRPMLDSSSMSSRDDFKAMARDDFAHTVLRPFLSQLSMYAYEAVYGMSSADVEVCRRGLLEDLLDLTTIVE